MNERIRAIMGKEWLDLRRNRTVLGTMLALPVLLTALSCGLMAAAAGAPARGEAGKLPDYLAKMSSDPHEAALIMMLNTALMLFSLVPVVLPSIMAAHSITGEKITRSLEPLLATPIRTWELLTGKLLAIILPSLLPALGGYAAYLVVLMRVAPPRVVELAMSAPFLSTVLVIGPLAAIFAVTFGMMVSSRTADLQAAQALSGLLVLPVVGVGMAQTFGAVSVTMASVLVRAGLLLVLDVGGLFLCISVFERETILSRWK